MAYPYAQTVHNLTKICIREAIEGLNLQTSPLKGIFRVLLRPPLRRFAVFFTDADQKITDGSLDQCGQALLERLSTSCQVEGVENIPRAGPLLVTSNHPGGLEILVNLANLHRPDVYMVSNDQPILRALPNASGHMIYLGHDPISRAGTIRQVIERLNDGCAVLIFPAGQMEPDPSVTPGALEFISNWSDSTGIFLSRVPQTQLVPVAVSGIIGKKAIQSWPVRRRKTLKGRQRVAAFLQMIVQTAFQDAWPIHMRIVFGKAVTTDLLAPSLEPRTLAEGVRTQIHALLRTLNPLPYTEPFKGEDPDPAIK